MSQKQTPKPDAPSFTPEKWEVSPEVALKVTTGFNLADVDRDATPGWTGSKKKAQKYLAQHEAELDALQERLFAQGRSGGSQRALLVLQGMDTAGKGGIVRHVVGMVDPQGVSIKNFGKPTPLELSHDFLWRIKNALPEPGKIGVFDRSHYEDVLVAKVRELAPPEELEARYEQINKFEAELVASGVAVIKCALLISPDEQHDRLQERLERPDKYWKYSPNDIAERALWPAYDQAYQVMFERTSTAIAPWYAIPANKKWYSQLAITKLLIHGLRSLDLQWPQADFDPAAELKRLAKTKVG